MGSTQSSILYYFILFFLHIFIYDICIYADDGFKYERTKKKSREQRRQSAEPWVRTRERDVDVGERLRLLCVRKRRRGPFCLCDDRLSGDKLVSAKDMFGLSASGFSFLFFFFFLFRL